MRSFLRDLYETGHVRVPLLDIEFEPAIECEADVRRFDFSARREFPGDAPQLNLPVAMWAAERLADSCRFAIARSAGEDEWVSRFSSACPGSPSPPTDYSVDLFFRYIPGVISIVRQLATADPLLDPLLDLTEQWPLSSVGLKLRRPVPTDRINVFCVHPGLRQLYADRIIATRDISRLGIPAVDSALRHSLGAYPELCPEIANVLSSSVPTIA